MSNQFKRDARRHRESAQQHVPQEVNEAVDLVTKETLRILAEAGVDISEPNSKDARDRFQRQLRDLDIEFRKVISADRPDMSGTGIFKAGIQIGFIPTLGVVCKGGKKVMV